MLADLERRGVATRTGARVLEIGRAGVRIEVGGRAEELVGTVSAPWVTARAVARLDKLARWCVPLLEPGGTRRDQLGVILGHRRGDDERAGRLHVARVVSNRYRNPGSGKICDATGCGVTPTDNDAAPMKELDERTHPGAPDSHEVDGSPMGCV
mgnify:CR=1 FL=1